MSSSGQPLNAPHTDAEMERPELLSTMRLAAVAQQIMQQFGAILSPGTKRFQRNGGIAVAQLGLRAQRYEEALQRIETKASVNVAGSAFDEIASIAREALNGE
jgi:hypothetical protein